MSHAAIHAATHAATHAASLWCMPFKSKRNAPYTYGDVLRLAVEHDVTPRTVQKVLDGHMPGSRQTLRVYRAILAGGKGHWIATPTPVQS